MNMLCCTLAVPAFLSRCRAPLACMAVLPQHLHPCPAHVAAPPYLRLETASLLPFAGEATLGKGDLAAKGESLYVKDYKY